MPRIRTDIQTPADVKFLVDTFYGKVQEDVLLSPVFTEVVEDWQEHLPTMYAFWNSVLLGHTDYKGHPFPKHTVLPIGKEHFERWLALFSNAIDANFAGEKAQEAKLRAGTIAKIFQAKMGL